jgi:hypothetical protein
MRIGSWEDWIKSMMVLEEDLFFELIRNYLGKIQTPFYKPNLVQRLSKFIQDSKTQDTLKRLFSPQDAVILSAIAFIPRADIKKLQTFFGPSWEYLNLFHTIRNLQERLLIYWSKGDEPGWFLTPFFREKNWEGYLGELALFPPEKEGGTDPVLVWLGTGFLLGLKSFISHKKVELDLQGNIKKRSISSYEEIFGSFQQGLLLKQDRLQRSLDTLTNLGLVELHGRRYRINETAWAEFWSMNTQKKYSLLWSAWLLRGQQEVISFATDLLSFLKYFSDGSYRSDTIRRFHWIRDYRWPFEVSLLQEMVLIGLMVKNEYGYTTNPAALDLLITAGSQTFTPVASTFVFKVDLHINAKHGSLAATLGEIQKFDYLSSFLLGQKGVYQFLEYYPDGNRPQAILEELCGGSLPANILFSLKDWEELFGAIKVERALVVSFDKESLGFFRSIPGFNELFLREVGEGIFLMKEQQMNLLEEILEEQSRPIPPIIDHISDKVRHNFPWAYFPWSVKQSKPKKPILSQYFSETLEFPLPKGLNDDEVEDYKSRISRGLILTERQMIPSLHPWEKTVAQGLDFRGKIRLIDNTVKDKKWLLEMQILGEGFL